MQENCRVCMSSRTESFSGLNESMCEATVIELMEFISGIEIDRNLDLPQNICSACVDNLTSAIDFKKKVLEAERLFRANIKDEDFKQETEELPEISELINEDNSDARRRESKRLPRKLAVSPKEKKLRKQTEEKKNKVPDEMDYKCFICDLVFDKVWSKNIHVRTDHESERICRICKSKSKTSLSLETHLKFHFRDYEFMCEICSKRFRYSNRLSSHMKLHHLKAVEMSCDLCGLSTKFKNNMKRHMRSVHLQLREFQCDHCPEHRYSTQEALKAHLYKYHDVPAPVRCPDCHHGFTFDSELRAHKKYGHCSKNINAPMIRRGKNCTEFLDVVGTTGEHICKICNESFPTKNKWSMHNYLKHKHSNKCEKCNIVFNNYTSVIRHDKVKHQGHKPFKCEFCSKAFGQKVSLISHRNTHTGEKTFSCAFCSFKSGDHGTVSKHKKKMHPKSTNALDT